MYREQDSVNRALVAIVLDALFVFLALYLAVQIRYQWPSEWPVIFRSGRYLDVFPRWGYLAVIFIWGFAFLVGSVYDPSRNSRLGDRLARVLFTHAAASAVFAGLLFLTARYTSRGLFLIFVGLAGLFLVGWRLLSHFLLRDRLVLGRPRQILIIGAGPLGRRVATVLQQEGSPHALRLVGFADNALQVRDADVPVLGSLEQVRDIVLLNRVDDVIIALPLQNYEWVNRLVMELYDQPVQIHVMQDYFNLALARMRVENFVGLPLVNLRAPALNEVQRLLKRLFDVGVILVCLLLTLPVMILIAVAIKLDSPGPVIYTQDRVGENGRLFKMYKFRSMIAGADKLQQRVNEITQEGALIHKQANDERVTRLGRFIRRTSLDELPQFFNILKGDMSIVGPRPELPWLVEKYELWQRRRFAVPQGLTGWWQINGRSERVMHLHTEDDLYYIENYSMWLDLYILLKTPLAVLRGRGAF